MKKTLTVNLGGTGFHIDEDAYRLLDNYLSNLKIHFHKKADADEIIDMSSERLEALKEEAGMLDVDTIMRYIRILSELTNQI